MVGGEGGGEEPRVQGAVESMDPKALSHVRVTVSDS